MCKGVEVPDALKLAIAEFDVIIKIYGNAAG